MSHKEEIGENGSGFRTRVMLEPAVLTPPTGDLRLEKQLCIKEQVTPHHGSSQTSVVIAAIVVISHSWWLLKHYAKHIYIIISFNNPISPRNLVPLLSQFIVDKAKVGKIKHFVQGSLTPEATPTIPWPLPRRLADKVLLALYLGLPR